LFTHQSQKESILFMDTGVTNIPNDMYPTAASGWLQVSRQGLIKVYYISESARVYMYISVYVLLKFYRSWNSVSLELLLSFPHQFLFKIKFYIKSPWYHFHEENTHHMFQRNWEAAMVCLQKKRPVIQCTIVFSVSSVSYFNCTNFTSM